MLLPPEEAQVMFIKGTVTLTTCITHVLAPYFHESHAVKLTTGKQIHVKLKVVV